MPLCLTLTYNSQWTIICHQATRTLFRLTSWQSPCCAPSHATAVRRFWLLLPCGTGWTSTARFNNSNRFHFTFQHQLGCQCNIEWCHYNRPISYQDTLTGRFGYHVAYFKSFTSIYQLADHFPITLINKLCHPPREINMRALGLPSSPWLIDRGTGHLPPLHSLGVCFGFFYVVYAVALLLVFISNFHEATFSLLSCSWQKGDRPDNGDVEPCSIQEKKPCARSPRM